MSTHWLNFTVGPTQGQQTQDSSPPAGLLSEKKKKKTIKDEKVKISYCSKLDKLWFPFKLIEMRRKALA